MRDLSTPSDDPLRIADPTLGRATPLLADIAASGVTVLILGETGVGKEVLAETIHALSGRAGPYLRVNCAALAEPLLESALFGHERGAFTGATALQVGLLEAAHGGTVFLDEIGELSPGVQAKLLRALETREITRLGATRPCAIDVRFVAATNRDLAAEAEAGRFRRDLYFRIDGISLHIPPLRERRDRIAPLAHQFLAAASARRGGAPPALPPAVLEALVAHAWPGNVRELKAVIGRALLLARGGPIDVRHVALGTAGAPAPPAPPAQLARGTRDLDERARILAALEACAGNQTRAARQLGMSRTTLVARLERYGIPRPRR